VASEPVSAPERPWALTRIALAGILLLAIVHTLLFLGYLTDDTFIHMQFAKNLLAGRGFSFNAGEPTYGATSPLWVLLIALTGLAVPGSSATPLDPAAIPSLAAIAKTWGLLSLLGAILLLYRLGRRLGWSPRQSLLAPFFLAANAWVARWTGSGMETPLAILLVVASLDALARTVLENRSAWPLGILLGLAFLARPECALLAFLAAVAVGANATTRKRLVGLFGGALLVAGPWLLTAWSWFHRILPNTSAAKAGAFGDLELATSALRTSLRILLATDALPIGLAIVGLALAGPEALRKQSPERRAFWIAVSAWPLALLFGFAMGGVQVVSRYLLPVLPSLALLGAASMAWGGAYLRAPLRSAGWTALVVLYLAQSAVLTIRYNVPHAIRHTAGLRSSLVAFGMWARHETPPGTLFALPDIGAFGYYADRPVLDLFGLVTPGMARVAVRAGYDAVVDRLLYEPYGRPAYLVDRARTAGRLERQDDPDDPYHFREARTIPDLGLTRPGTWTYSLYDIDWAAFDRSHPHLAGLNPRPRRAIIMGFPKS
jgi:arabinofuranosyltransferase